MILFKLLFLFLISFPSFASPRDLAQKYIGKKNLKDYFEKPVPLILKGLNKISANKRNIIDKKILLNLYGHNYDTTLSHDGRDIISFTRVFYEENKAPDIFKEIEIMGKDLSKPVKIEGGPRPGIFYDFNFSDSGVFFRFNKNKIIQIITIKKIKKAVKS